MYNIGIAFVALKRQAFVIINTAILEHIHIYEPVTLLNKYNTSNFIK